MTGPQEATPATAQDAEQLTRDIIGRCLRIEGIRLEPFARLMDTIEAGADSFTILDHALDIEAHASGRLIGKPCYVCRVQKRQGVNR